MDITFLSASLFILLPNKISVSCLRTVSMVTEYSRPRVRGQIQRPTLGIPVRHRITETAHRAVIRVI